MICRWKQFSPFRWTQFFTFCLTSMNTKSVISILILWLNISIQSKSFVLHLWNSNTFHHLHVQFQITFSLSTQIRFIYISSSLELKNIDILIHQQHCWISLSKSFEELNQKVNELHQNISIRKQVWFTRKKIIYLTNKLCKSNILSSYLWS